MMKKAGSSDKGVRAHQLRNVVGCLKLRNNVVWSIVWIVACVNLFFLIGVDALFGNKKRKQREAELLAKKLAEEAARRQKICFAIAFIVVVLVGIGSYIYFEGPLGIRKGKKGNRPGVEGTVDVVVVGCGLPKKSMGWYHITQLLEMKNVNLRAIIEPFFLNPDLCKDVPPSFSEFVTKTSDLGVQFAPNIEDLPKFQKLTLCLIAARTADNPNLFKQCIERGAKCIFLEKPGAPSVEELREMKELADSKNVKVYVGFNKHVTPYVRNALALSRQVEDSHVFFSHNNSYETKDLAEVFTRNPEGMMKNMCVHELALLNTFFGVSVETIAKFKVNTGALFSQKLTVWQPGTAMPNPKYITDFSRCAFKITTTKGKSISVMADRCGGNVSFAVVKDANGMEVKKFEFPDDQLMKKVSAMIKEDPEMMPYFFIQSDDYLELKKLVVNSLLDNSPPAEEIATIDTAIEALRLAEYCTEKLESALKAA